jgi:hypothetical protein
VKEEYGHPFFEDYTAVPQDPYAGDLMVFTVTVNNDGQIHVEDQLVEIFVDDKVEGTPTVSVPVDTPVQFTFEWEAEVGSHIMKFVMGEETLEFVQKVLPNEDPESNPGAKNKKGAEVTNPKTGQAIAFAANAEDHDGDEMTYLWDFGDGTTSYEANPSHVYDKPGDYTVTVTVTDCHGGSCTETFEMQVTKPKDENGSPGFGAIVAASAMAVALLGAAMARRRS